MKLFFSLVVAVLLVPVASADDHVEGGKIRVLMMTGQNNHDWKKTTPALQAVIESSGRFELVIDETPWEFGPDAFEGFDVIFSNWSVWPKVDSDPWSDETKAAFLAHIGSGKGLLVMHAGSSVHYPWDEFQALVGKTWIKKKTWHGKKHEFDVSFPTDHPITRGVEPFTIFDELWRNMIPTGPFETLAVADTSNDKRPGPVEPMLMTTSLGDGRGVNLVLGHDTRSIGNEGFQKLLLRSLEWAATGDVAE
ncbi:MAG: ThuA domain-containing protein [Planctomycetota bacterium]